MCGVVSLSFSSEGADSKYFTLCGPHAVTVAILSDNLYKG